MTLSDSALAIIALASAGCALLALIVALGLGRRLRQVRRSYSLRHRAESAADVAGGVDSLELAELRQAIVHSIQRVGLVRFDAFEDMGGRLSFAVALLDADGDGVVMSSINGRNETRIYAKPVEQGVSRINLSTEEEDAIRRALRGIPVGRA
ncbi:MAG: DUF4446 family protein [Actinomycetota bacterium]